MMISWETTQFVGEMFNYVLQSEHTSLVQTISDETIHDYSGVSAPYINRGLMCVQASAW
jgi:hypothetical protein